MVLSNLVFGELTTVSPRYNKGHFEWFCNCSCGNSTYVRAEHLKSGKQQSCGHCNHKDMHPYAYKSWDSMKQRCLNPNAPDYSRYGGRGITICQSWKQSFMNFFRDMGDPPTDSLTGKRFTLNRKDNDGNYEPDNCEWADDFKQSNNRTNSLSPAIAATRIMRPISRR